MAGPLVITVLLTDAYGGRGGIAKFNRDFLQAMDASELVERIRVLPRIIRDPISGPTPESVIYDRQASKGKSWFARRLARLARDLNAIDLVICGHLNLLPLAWALARLKKARLALVIHGIEAWTSAKAWRSSTLLLRNIDNVISVSERTATRFCKWSGVDARKMYILPNCVDLETFVPRLPDRTLTERYGLQNSKVIMTVGRLVSTERYKGFDEVIDTLPRLATAFPNLKYLIVGDGTDRARLESKAKALGVFERIVFAGYIPESEKVAHYSLADVYVMPSSGEGFGIVLIEAAACGLPVIGSDADGSREALLGGQLGYLVNPTRSQELIALLAELLTTRRERARPNGIETFGISQFQNRVATWLHTQAG